MNAFAEEPFDVAVIGGGPAGLFAAEKLAESGLSVEIFERMPSPGRKFLMAGRGGLNLTHSEPLPRFMPRYGEAERWLNGKIQRFPPEALRDWADGLGAETFAGTSGRVFPNAMKASPLLRAWLRRLEQLGVRINLRHEWQGWNGAGDLRFSAGEKEVLHRPKATVLALGGASWPKLGSDGRWSRHLPDRGVCLTPFRPSNCGVLCEWSPVFIERHAGEPLKRVTASISGEAVKGEAVITRKGLQGGLIYALSPVIRRVLDRAGEATLTLDLRPDLPLSELQRRLRSLRPGDSLSNGLRKAAGLAPVAIGLLHEHAIRIGRKLANLHLEEMAHLIAAMPLPITGVEGLEYAISTAGGVSRDALDGRQMLKAIEGVFVAGEMIDWDAPTGGYLLQACFATGLGAAEGVIEWLRGRG